MAAIRHSVTTLASDVWSSTQLKLRLVGTVYRQYQEIGSIKLLKKNLDRLGIPSV